MSAAARLGLGLAAAAALVLASEGVLSLGFARSWRELLARPAPVAPPLELEREQAVAARATSGTYRVSEDPLVGFTLELESSLRLDEGGVGTELTSDALGLRARVAPAPASAAVRIVVLGDELAFGLGLAGEDVLAAQLERLLAPLVPGGVECETVAVPGWNARNAWRFLLDHLERFRPTIVLYLPRADDLEDGYGVDEVGRRCVHADPAAAEPLLHVHPDRGSLARREALQAAGEPVPHLGPEVLAAGVGATARARFGELAETLADGAARLARAGSQLALAFPEPSDFQRELEAELARRHIALAVVPWLERIAPDDSLGRASQPSAAATAAFACWSAESFCELGWLSAEVRAGLPAVALRYASRRARACSAEELLRWSADRRAALEDELEARVEPASLQGALQVLGGLNPGGTLGLRFAAVLRRGARLRVRLEPIPTRRDLYPLEVRVRVAERDGERELGTVVVPAIGTAEGVFELGPAEGAAGFEVRLDPTDWAVIASGGREFVAAARLLELASEP